MWLRPSLFRLAFVCRAGLFAVTLSHQNLRMYSPEQTKKLQQQTNNLLAAGKTHPIEKNKLEELKDVLRFHEYRYAIMNDPLISDFEYDGLYKQLEHIEAAHPNLVTSDSPTQRVAKGLTKEFPT